MAKKITIQSEFYRPIIKLVLTLVILAIANRILIDLPMIRELVIPRVFISAGAIVSAVIGTIMIVTFLKFKQDFVPRVQAALTNFPEGEAIVSSGITLGVIAIAYAMFDNVILPLIGEFRWAYPVFFLLLAIAPLCGLIPALYGSLDRVTNLVTGRIAKVAGEVTECPQCGKTNPRTANFCGSCGADTQAVQEAAQGPTSLPCPKCSAENSPDTKFCQSCGSSLSPAKQ